MLREIGDNNHNNHNNNNNNSNCCWTLGVVTKKMQNWISKTGVEIRTELLQKTTLLGIARILRRVLQM